MKFFGEVRHGQRNNRFGFGGDPESSPLQDAQIVQSWRRPGLSECFLVYSTGCSLPPEQHMGDSAVPPVSQSQCKNIKGFLVTTKTPPTVSIAVCPTFLNSSIFPIISKHTCSMPARLTLQPVVRAK